MEQPFIPAPEDANADVYLCLFPYLKQFLAFDAREGQSRVMLLSVDDVLGEEFYRTVETEISEMLRESSEYPLAHLMNLPGQIEEAVRGVAVTFILDRIGIRTNPEDPEDVMVFAVGGGGPAAPPDVALQGLKWLLQSRCGIVPNSEWEQKIADMIAEQNSIEAQFPHHNLAETIAGDAPDYFNLWENRN